MLKLLIKTRKDSYTGIERNFAEYLSNKNITLKIEDNLHKKAVITSTFFYMGSANLTYSGMNLNNEQCSIGIRAYNASLINDLLTR
jgi:phosphatidylserine/phosphatidylglycerophosphate/cardiolipin synthase-like enzyme